MSLRGDGVWSAQGALHAVVSDAPSGLNSVLDLERDSRSTQDWILQWNSNSGTPYWPRHHIDSPDKQLRLEPTVAARPAHLPDLPPRDHRRLEPIT